MAGLQPSFNTWTIDQVLVLHSSHRIKLDPGFQRNSVWSLSDRRKLIESILQGYPLPSIFLYRRDHEGSPVYEVIDGKQRLETILMFTKASGFRQKSFDVRADLGDGIDRYDWNSIRRHYPQYQSLLSAFKLQVVEVTGNLKDIVDLFVRINSTGKSLTSGEKRNAKFYTSPFLKEANSLVSKHQRYLLDQQILSQGQLDRMKGVELFSELLISIDQGGIINKKISLDRTIGNEKINAHTLRKLSTELVQTLNVIKKAFPRLRETRFRNSAEFYSLFLLVWKMRNEKFVLGDQTKHKKAFALLSKLSSEVDTLRTRLRELRPPKDAPRLAQDYLLTIQGDTDSAATRERREKVLKGLIWSIYDRKDDRRLFTPEQKRILWNRDDDQKCPKCGGLLRWDDISVDHIVAYTRGGKATLRNAQLMHRSCNSSKGAR
ncbi:MAG: DUF262 domain-containing protein [Rhodopseudomonas sp.]|uniref:GmrSD restriction endonuclease domain-containing protein n=1 Tax=Rhodopseudomonas sp. TaxID=1078 RepID=UPI0039E4E269